MVITVLYFAAAIFLFAFAIWPGKDVLLVPLRRMRRATMRPYHPTIKKEAWAAVVSYVPLLASPTPAML
jgi:hypothetical protein